MPTRGGGTTFAPAGGDDDWRRRHAGATWHRGRRRAKLRAVTPLERELRLLRAFALLTYPFACVPFLYFYFRGHGLDLPSYGTVVTVYYLTMFAADVPTSIVADRIGRRGMLVLGPLVLAAGFATVFVWRTFAGFCVGEALMGLGHSVLSGPPAAMLYELLRRHGEQHRFLQEEARMHGLRLTGTGASFLLGGALASGLADEAGYAFAATIPATSILLCLAAAVASRLQPEPSPPHVPWRDFVRRATDDLMLREVRWLLAYWVLLFLLLRYPFHNYQVWLDELAPVQPVFGNPLFVGTVFALLNLVAAPLSRKVPLLVSRFGRRRLFFCMPLLLGASMAAMAGAWFVAAARPGAAVACAWFSVLMFFVQQVPFAMHWALVQEFVNHRIRPEARTTIWSVLSLGGRLGYAPANQALFALQGAFGTAHVLGATGLIGIAASAVVLRLRPRGLFRT